MIFFTFIIIEKDDLIEKINYSVFYYSYSDQNLELIIFITQNFRQ